jgi:predicted nuclease with RNAse H fold
VDVAGASNTWATAISPGEDGLKVVHEPHLARLKTIVDYCQENNVVAAAIDAQLTIALSEDSGFRTSDLHLRELLPPDCRNWVASINSLMAVPIRGRLLADHLSPTVGTLLETHPRASLLFALGNVEGVHTAARGYKPKSKDTYQQLAMRRTHTHQLWRLWSERFGIAYEGPVYDDGALDSLVCATVAYQFHHAPDALYRLRHDVAGKTGRGPFYVLARNVQDA